MAAKTSKEDALRYHSKGRPGKIEVVPTKETKTQRDLALAYSPGVAEPCLAIAANPDDVYKYTAKGNLVGVISNGTAVLGLGDIGPEASKPVMEGKGILFKIFADIDVFDIELNARGIDEFVAAVKAMEPTFGGINLEDIKAPECFEIETRLKAEMNIPVMHDDQHGTAIISGAALINALELVNKKIEKIKLVVNGAGASAISCAKLYMSLGVKQENIVMLDRNGVIRKDRGDKLDDIKRPFATARNISTLEEAMKDADVFLGLSKGNVVNQDMVKSMAKKPIVFALANPDPEIPYEQAIAARKDVIVATGRSDYPNQVNNALGFPFIFRGALDVRAKEINEPMKLAAVYALANLAKEPVPEMVNIAYDDNSISFGNTYIIPKLIDPRLITAVSPAVAKAAIDSGVARKTITDWDAYDHELRTRLGLDDNIIRVAINKAKRDPKRVIFAEADNFKILRAAQRVIDEGIAKPILLGNENKIRALMAENNIELDVPIIDSRHASQDNKRIEFGQKLFEKRKRKGLTLYEARKLMYERNYFGAMMVENGEADALISGLTKNYPSTIRPALQIIGLQEGVKKVAGMYLLLTKKGPVFFADCTVNANPTSEELVDITLLTAKHVNQFNITPRIAMLSYSNFGSARGAEPETVSAAVKILQQQHPGLVVDGEMQANFAFNTELLKDNFPFSALVNGGANTVIFPNLSSGNIAYKLLQTFGAAEAVGPVLMGLNKAVHILQLGSSVREIVNMVTIAVVDAQTKTQIKVQKK